MDPRTRFSATATDYVRARPDYPSAWVEALGALLPSGGRVVEVGSGTGILARQLAAEGLDVLGVEPNVAMRAQAVAAAGGPTYQEGQADALGLPDDSADLVVAAQAFHWFALAPTLLEWRRVLRPGGHGAALWNDRDLDDPAMASWEALLHRHSETYADIPRPAGTLAALRAALATTRELDHPHHQDLDRAGVHARAWSSSYVVHGVEDRGAFDSALDAWFNRYARHGVARFSYRCVGVIWVV